MRAGPISVGWHRRDWLLSLGLLPLCGCTQDRIGIDEIGTVDFEGRVESVTTLGHYSGEEFLAMFSGLAGPVKAEHDFYLYRVVYPTRAADGRTVSASGLIALPSSRQQKGIVSWQHGTNTFRPESISKPSVPEGVGLGGLFAGDGYIMVAPDYIGLGVSTEQQLYYDWPSLTSTALDLIAIAARLQRRLAPSSPEELYLAGFSEGAGLTLALQRRIESRNTSGLELKRVAAVAGAYDPLRLSFGYTIAANSPAGKNGALYCAFLLFSLAITKNAELSTVVRDEYASEAPGWFDGTRTGSWFAGVLPENARALLREEFVQAFEAGLEEPAWVFDGLREIQTSNFRPVAPIRLFYGTSDVDVIPDESRQAARAFRALGAPVEEVELGPFTHDEVLVQAAPFIQAWFDESATLSTPSWGGGGP